jgi:ribose 5-phosphate isomerase B
MKIHLATDHAGYTMKEFIKTELINLNYDVIDHGANYLDDNDDYPDFISLCSDSVSKDTESFGIIFGGSGQGEAMCANRTDGIRAGIYYGGDVEIIKLLREHNNANILSIGARFINNQQALECVNLFLNTEFSKQERHIRRIAKF